MRNVFKKVNLKKKRPPLPLKPHTTPQHFTVEKKKQSNSHSLLTPQCRTVAECSLQFIFHICGFLWRQKRESEYYFWKWKKVTRTAPEEQKFVLLSLHIILSCYANITAVASKLSRYSTINTVYSNLFLPNLTFNSRKLHRCKLYICTSHRISSCRSLPKAAQESRPSWDLHSNFTS